MEDSEQTISITSQDIVFECPNCGKSMAIDEAAAGMMVECQGCQINVIVPDRPTASVDDELLAASRNGDTDAVRALLARAADVQTRDATGWTPLMRAAHSGNRDIVQALLRHGADVHSTGENGVTALKLAERAGHFHVLRDLWKAGARS